MKKLKYFEEDVLNDKVDHLIKNRILWILIGLFGGIIATFIVSSFETILSTDVRLAFFIPIIVYLSDALGTQTETIYVRELSERKKISFAKYIFKECIIGFSLGIISAITLGIFAIYWLSSFTIGLAIALTMFVNLTIAPVLSIIIPNILYHRHTDPALGSGPIATIIQDLISLLIYFLFVKIIIFS